ncbi:MAG: acyl-CoA dehydrogenase C-terminal domain-containing protein [Alphaproteobacteria bacterium]|nr:acyl-CoA dehydrogenase C-terminal domain-containing protein [Alphaproteobacteria bacterium]
MQYKAPLNHIQFILQEVLDLQDLCKLPYFQEFEPSLVQNFISEAAAYCEEFLLPLNQISDSQGCHLDQNQVKTPDGFREAYQKFIELGWPAAGTDPAYGGMKTPYVVLLMMAEFLSSTNLAFGMYPGLSKAAYKALTLHGSEELKATYLPKIISGEWTGTMCLTEPQCGTDLSLIATKALPRGDGSYSLTGSKIFISAGDHDLSENIIHLVLAKLPDAPKGAKGISLFIVPKFLPSDMSRNQVKCSAIEHKMGLNGSATCSLEFEGAQGWLVGKPHHGLEAMFTMMNNARLSVAMQGLGAAEIAQQNATIYASERVQMRSLSGPKNPAANADPILVHADVRRMILTGKAFCEGARALSCWAAMEIDMAEHHPDPFRRAQADDLVALLTPILKAYQTDMGFDVANLAIQVYGGHGYIKDYGIEQLARDVRVASIYEGTNGIQALDLVGRKMGKDYGRVLRSFFHPVQEFIARNSDHPVLKTHMGLLAKSFAKLQQASATIALKSLKNPDEAGAAATDYLRLFALVAMAYMWMKMAVVAVEKLGKNRSDGNTAPQFPPQFYAARLKLARFFMERMLPEAESRFRMVMAGGESMMEPSAEEFFL